MNSSKHQYSPLPIAECSRLTGEPTHKDGWKSPWCSVEKMSDGLRKDRIKFFGLNSSEREEVQAELSKLVITKIEVKKKVVSDTEYKDIAKEVLERIAERNKIFGKP